MHRAFCRFLALVSFGALLTASAQEEPTAAQPRLPTVTLTAGNAKIVAEVADDDAERTAGLMFRESLGDNEGMLFVLDAPQPVAFWMKNTNIPLSIAYINPAGVIVEIHDLEPGSEESVSSEFTSVAYGLEMPQGWFLKNGVLAGDEIQGLPVPAGE